MKEYAYKGKKVTIMGLGLFGGGVGAAQFFARAGARVMVTDLRNASVLSPALKQLEGLPISYRLGMHCREDFSEADIVIVNPAVPWDSEYLQIARDHGVTLDTEVNLFIRLCPAPIIGITGSNGKSTTTTLIAEIMSQTPYRTWVGGNIGKSLLPDVEEIKPQDIVIMELSSFQLQDLHREKRSPHISVLTNVTPNHLDRHKNMGNYIHAKKSIMQYQTQNDYIILNYEDMELRKWVTECRGQVMWYSVQHPLPAGGFLEGNTIVLSFDGCVLTIPCISEIRVPGVHNLQNILAAACAAFIAGADRRHIKDAVTTFTGLEHRLEFVREVNGVHYYNDSKATTPESAIAAITAFKAPLILIAGGYDKGNDLGIFADLVARCARGVVLIGQTSWRIRDLILREKTEKAIPAITVSNTLEDAFKQANLMAKAGDTVLLSPGCASYGMFLNYEERGNRFKELVRAL